MGQGDYLAHFLTETGRQTPKVRMSLEVRDVVLLDRARLQVTLNEIADQLIAGDVPDANDLLATS